MTNGRAAASSSAWAPLREPLFRVLWIAAFASNVGTWMQNVAAAWLMTSLTSSATLVAPGEQLDLTPSAHWPEPAVVMEPDPEEGPVLVTIEYRIDPGRAQEFVRVMDRLGRSRRRSGATLWGVFRDAADPSRYLEIFIVDSWVEHLRQHERVSVAEKDLQENVLSFHLGEAPPMVSHFIAGAPSAN